MKPILFSTAMVQAILAGTKTQTRRIIKSRHESGLFQIARNKDGRICSITSLDWDERCANDTTNDIHCRYKVGDTLWVRETWRPKRHRFPIGYPYEYRATAEQDLFPVDEPWKPSIFMPRKACRLFLEVTNIRVERLHDISEQDAIAEGYSYSDWHRMNEEAAGVGLYSIPSKPINWYSESWESINGPGSWEKNPFVWVIEFKRVNPLTHN